MRFIVQFQDNPGKENQRQKHMAKHLEFLHSNAKTILAAGPVFDTDGTGQGGVWLVEATDSTAVQKLIETDPFFATGLRKSCDILRWQQVFRDGARV